MEWIRAHPYIAALCATSLTIVVGVWMIQRQSRSPASNTITAWSSGDLGIVDSTPYSPTQNTVTKKPNVPNTQSGSYTYTPPAIFSAINKAGEENSFDLNAFISKLTQVPTVKQNTSVQSNSSSDVAINEAYSFIPSGFLSTTTAEIARSTTEEAVYQYGNTVGSFIKSFEQQYPGAATILRDQAEDRTNPLKASKMDDFAHAMENVGKNMLTIGEIPQGIATAHAALAHSYIEIGNNLGHIPQAKTDAEFLAAIETYNNSADTFVKHYIALATLLTVYGASFTAADAGSVFTFAPTSSF